MSKPLYEWYVYTEAGTCIRDGVSKTRTLAKFDSFAILLSICINRLHDVKRGEVVFVGIYRKQELISLLKYQYGMDLQIESVS